MQKMTNWIMPYKAQVILILFTLIVFPNKLQALSGFAHGWVYSRGIVTNDLGQYTWSRYNIATGDYLGDVGVADSSLDPEEWRVMSGEEYRNIIQQKADLHEAQEDLEFLSRAEYESASLLLANGQPMTKPSLSNTTGYVSILPQLRRLIDDPQSLILAEYPVNPNVAVDDNIVSILYKYRGDNIGAIHLQSTDRIGFKVAFAKDSSGNSNPNNDTHNFGLGGTLPVSPLAGIGIDSALMGGGMTNEDGHFTAIWFYPPCPLVPFNYSNLLTAKLYFTHFNPRLTNRLNSTTTATRTLYDACIPEVYYIPIIGPYPLNSGTIEPHLERILFTVDFSYLSGVAYLSDHISVMNNRVLMDGNKIPVTSKSQYQAEVPDNTLITAQYYDFDRDKINDTVLSGHLEDKPVDDGEDACEAKGKLKKFVAGDPKDLQGVWLSSSGHTPLNCQPDFTRIIDHKSYKNKNHQGLLSEIAAEDLRNTDIYIVRLSDGKLISERIGLNESEYFLGEDQGRDRFFYTLGVYGNRRGGFQSERFISFEDWQSKNGMNPELHERKADHVKPGDALRIYAINRATGYIGHVDTTYEIMGENSALLGSKIDPIIMGPPNLRIKVERDYKIDKGASASTDTITQLIGFEGASLTSDRMVAITTEWLDNEGHPMPESLKDAGYTGRIAILSGDKTLPGNNQGVYQFAIEPGKHLQVIQLPSALTDREHFYIHVSGEPKSGQAIFAGSTRNERHSEVDFKSTGQNPGILENRPDHYVPFLVPVYDEESSELQMQAYRLMKETDPNIYNTPPEPLYRWVYRPEMQFTSYDLKIDEINRSDDKNANGTFESEEVINIYNQEAPKISTSSVVDILYGLSTTDLLPLDYFNAGSEKELVFAIGEQEIKATLGDNQKIIFHDLNHLPQISPDHFLTIRLYASNDMGNTLWEWAFLNLDVDVDSDNNNELNLPDRTREEESIENAEGHPGKILTVNYGDTDDDDIPDFADFDSGEPFAPMVVQIPDDVNIESAKIKFTYEQSDPTLITVDDSVTPPIYEPDPGFMRIWNKNGNEERSIDDITAGGNFIRNEQEASLTLFDINDDGEIVLYTELVRDKNEWGGLKTRIEIIE